MLFENENWSLKIEQDENPQNPRSLDYTDCNVSKMVCFHSRYNMGDKHDYRQSDYNSWDELKAAIKVDENVAVILPIYMYEHSSITIATTPFSCRWDSGQIGFVYITKESILEHLVVGKKYVTKKLIQKGIKAIEAEIETYKQYIGGDVYIYECTDKKLDETDSCCGFYGSNIWENGIVDNLPIELVIELYNELKAKYGVSEFIEKKIKELSI